MKHWLHNLRVHGVRALVRHPHHYAVAAQLSTAMLILGHYSAEHHVAAWLYAAFENLSTVSES